jgi:hypothetical protein
MTVESYVIKIHKYISVIREIYFYIANKIEMYK